MKIRLYNDKTDRKAVVSLLKSVFLVNAPHNDPETSIDRKLNHADELLFVAVDDGGRIAGSIMAGYDGHRGWIYSLAVDRRFRRKGTGSLLLSHAEQALEKLGCPKVNLQVLTDNKSVVGFYKKNGYIVEKRISMGKKLY
ncbi:MAG: GNAT family acetyltransferase [Spirochaetales bacterium]|nr:GNAT family acetyltransferase [Spirochaetales bacterium]